MKIDILSLFPGYFKGPFDESMIKRAKESGLIEIDLLDMRSFAEGKHMKADDRPFGGGPGMVLKPDVVTKAVRSVKREDSKVIYLSPQGSLLTAQKSRALAQEKHLIMLCGHYEGIDERALDLVVDEEISIGDYVLTNGCLAAIVLVDSLIRFIPGVLGHKEGADKDSFEEGIFDHPQYTQPVNFEGISVPQVLTEGHHNRIERWRRQKALEKTRAIRPELFLQALDDLEDVEIQREVGQNKATIVPVLFVENLKKSVSFYTKQLKWKLITKGERSASLELLGSYLKLVEEPIVSQHMIEMVIADKESFQMVTKGIKSLIEDPDGHLWNIRLKGV